MVLESKYASAGMLLTRQNEKLAKERFHSSLNDQVASFAGIRQQQQSIYTKAFKYALGLSSLAIDFQRVLVYFVSHFARLASPGISLSSATMAGQEGDG